MGSSPKEVKEVALGFHLSSLLPVHVLPAPCQGLFKGATDEAKSLTSRVGGGRRSRLTPWSSPWWWWPDSGGGYTSGQHTLCQPRLIKTSNHGRTFWLFLAQTPAEQLGKPAVQLCPSGHLPLPTCTRGWFSAQGHAEVSRQSGPGAAHL